MDALKAAGLYENTIIISTTDHGLANPFSKCTLFDRGIGVSLIVRIPQYPLTHGTWYNGMVSHVDLFPTLCDAEGLPKPAWLSGVSLLPVLRIHNIKYGIMYLPKSTFTRHMSRRAASEHSDISISVTMTRHGTNTI